METVAGLPKYVVLRSHWNGKYVHYLWDAEEFQEYYKDLGPKRDVDPVSPFAKLEVVPSQSGAGLVHLRCSYNNKYLQLVPRHGVPWVSATADAPVEDTKDHSSTVFKPLFPSPGKGTVVELEHVQSQLRAHPFWNPGPDYPERMQDVLVGYKPAGAGEDFLRFDFAPWESYGEKMAAKDAEIRKLNGEVAVKEEEIGKLNGEVAAKEEEIGKLNDEVAAKEAEIGKLADEVADLKVKEEERKAKQEEGMEKLKSQVVSAWESYEEIMN